MKKSDGKLFFILAALALVIGGFMIYSKAGDVSERRANVAATQAEVDKAEGIAKDLAQSEQDVRDLQTKLVHLERGVQDYQQVPYMLKDLEKFGNANGLTVLGVRVVPGPPPNPDAKGDKKPYDQITVEIKGRGLYSDATRFLVALKDFPQIVAVRTVTLSPRIEPNAPQFTSPTCDMTAEVNVFVFPEPTPAASNPDSAVASAGGSSNG